jgi:hypothetical protein
MEKILERSIRNHCRSLLSDLFLAMGVSRCTSQNTQSDLIYCNESFSIAVPLKNTIKELTNDTNHETPLFHFKSPSISAPRLTLRYRSLQSCDIHSDQQTETHNTQSDLTISVCHVTGQYIVKLSDNPDPSLSDIFSIFQNEINSGSLQSVQDSFIWLQLEVRFFFF